MIDDFGPRTAREEIVDRLGRAYYEADQDGVTSSEDFVPTEYYYMAEDALCCLDAAGLKAVERDE